MRMDVLEMLELCTDRADGLSYTHGSKGLVLAIGVHEIVDVTG